MVIDVDDVVGYPGEACVRTACSQLYISDAGWLDQSEFSCGQWNNDVVMPVNVIAGVGTRSKGPLRDDHTLVLNLKCGDGIHGCLLAR